MVQVLFMIPKENKWLQLPGSTSTIPGSSEMSGPPRVGFEMTDVGTGFKYRVVSVQDARHGSTAPGELDYVAELERV
jgi:hypothetical protein